MCSRVENRVRVELNDSITIQSQIGRTGLDFERHPYVSAVIEKMREFVPIKGIFFNC